MSGNGTGGARRSTLAHDSNSNNPTYSGFGYPSSAVKPTKSSYLPRASMIPQQTAINRTNTTNLTRDQLFSQSQYYTSQPSVPYSTHPGQSGPSSVRRGESASYASRQSMVSVGRQSVAVSATPINTRRNTNNRLSIAPGTSSISNIRESRPIKDKQYRARMTQTVKDHLERTGFTMAGWDPNKGVQEPTQSAFVGMFRHIFSTCVDSNYVMVYDNKTRKFEEEALTMLKDIKYPSSDELSKTKLSAAGSHSNWPYCLAMLEWMVSLGNLMNSIPTGPRSRVNHTEDLQSLFFPYLWDCYDRFWQNEDNYPEEHSKNQSSPLELEEQENGVKTRDVQKFRLYYDECLVPKLEKTKKTNEKLENEIAVLQKEIQDHQNKKIELQKKVDQQEVSSEEYERMVAKKDQLSSSLEILGQKNRDAAQQGFNLELVLTRKRNEIEEKLDEFNPLARTIGLLPLQLSSENTIHELKLTTANPSTMLQPGIDVRNNLRKQIEFLRSQESEKYREASRKRLELQGDLERLIEQLTEKENELNTECERYADLKLQSIELDNKTKTLQEQFKHEEARLEKLTREINQTSNAKLSNAESRLTALQFTAEKKQKEWDFQRLKMDEDMLNFLVLLSKMKGEVASQLEEIQAVLDSKSRDD